MSVRRDHGSYYQWPRPYGIKVLLNLSHLAFTVSRYFWSLRSWEVTRFADSKSFSLWDKLVMAWKNRLPSSSRRLCSVESPLLSRAFLRGDWEHGICLNWKSENEIWAWKREHGTHSFYEILNMGPRKVPTFGIWEKGKYEIRNME